MSGVILLPRDVLAYVAGVIDARGYARAELRRDRPEPRIRVTTRRTELLEYLAKLTGTKVRIDAKGCHCDECRAANTARARKYRKGA